MAKGTIPASPLPARAASVRFFGDRRDDRRGTGRRRALCRAGPRRPSTCADDGIAVRSSAADRRFAGGCAEGILHLGVVVSLSELTTFRVLLRIAWSLW